MSKGKRFGRDIPIFPAIRTSEELIGYCERLYQKAGDYANRVNEFYPDVNAFIMMHNFLILTKELLQYHRLHWKTEKQETLRGDDLERIITITRWDFIASVSIAERARFCQMTPEFLRQPLEEREVWIPKWRDIAKKFGLKMLFWGSTIGVKEHVVFVFEAQKNHDSYMAFQREWLSLNTRCWQILRLHENDHSSLIVLRALSPV